MKERPEKFKPRWNLNPETNTQCTGSQIILSKNATTITGQRHDNSCYWSDNVVVHETVLIGVKVTCKM